jgi:uncharacterized protein YjbI with pentapeptide repeats
MADKVDPFDVEALEKSLNDSATRVSALWISFLIFGLYLVIAAGTVTHKQLFLAEPVKLPVLNIELPLVGFFFLAPILFVIFHAYVLLQVLLLGRTAAAYNEAVEHTIKVAADNARVRQRLANTLFAQIFAGSPRERDGWLGFLLKTMAWITLAIAPVLILLFFQFQFLPYHSAWVTWAIRFLLVIDLAIILVLWPAARDPGHEVTLRGVFRQWVALPTAIVTAAFAWIVLTFPGEPHAEWTRYWPDREARSTAHKFGDDLECETQSPVSRVFPSFDRLNLPRVDAVDDEALKKIEQHTKAVGEPDYQGERTRLLRKRDFNCADLSDFADLRRVDLTNASLRGARFNRSKLQGASLEGAKLQGASLFKVQLQGASLDGAELQGASLLGGRLQGASLLRAELQGASLDGAELQGASLDGAQLQGASLAVAELQGASLSWAELQGASLDGAELQGANLDQAALRETALSRAAVWRARNAKCAGARFQDSEYEAIIKFDFREPAKSVHATPDNITKFIDDAIKDIPNPKMKQQAIDRMRAGLIVDSAKDDTAEIANVWHKCEEESAKVSQVEFDKKHIEVLRELVCDAKESRDAIAKGIIRNWISGDEDRRDFSAQLARGLLGEDGKPCAATQDLDEADIKKLRAAIAHAPNSPAPTAPASPSAAPAPVVAPPAAAAASEPAPASMPK